MEKIFFTISSTLMFVFWSLPVFSDGPGWTELSQVEKLVVTALGGVNVRLSPELSGCVSQSGYGAIYASVYPDHPGINIIQANLLSAYMSGKPVRLYLGDDECKVTEMILGED